eukprot:1745912-Alexandrium_andersonii.AAC.1
MSASLVGSEMCIRDSLAILGPPGTYERAGRWLLPPPLHSARAGKEASVSYTHLTLPTICSV